MARTVCISLTRLAIALGFMVQSSGRLKIYAPGWVTLCRNVSRIEASRWVTFDQNSNFFRIAKRLPGLYRVTLHQNHWVTLDKNMQVISFKVFRISFSRRSFRL